MHPNLLGYEMLMKFSLYESAEILISASSCFQHNTEFLCYLFIPKCDPETNQIIPPCKQMCCGYSACSPKLGKWKHINCNYLPSFHEEIPCFYKPVRCKKPPKVKNSTVVTYFTLRGKYLWHHKAEYSCNQGFKMEGK